MNQFRAATISFGAWEHHLNIWTPQESKRYDSYVMGPYVFEIDPFAEKEVLYYNV